MWLVNTSDVVCSFVTLVDSGSLRVPCSRSIEAKWLPFETAGLQQMLDKDNRNSVHKRERNRMRVIWPAFVTGLLINTDQY